MPGAEQIAEALECFKTVQHRCEACAYNPSPGRMWVYGCVRGQIELAGDAQAVLREVNEHGRMGDADREGVR